MHIEDLEMARLLFATAFAGATPLHLPEGLTGEPVIASPQEKGETWQSPPTVVRSLRPIFKGSVERSIEAPMLHNEQDLFQLKRQHDAEASARQQRFARLLREPLLDVGALGEITPQERTALSEMIDGCLCSPAQEYRLPDGSFVTLLNRSESCYVAVHSCDGVLWLPRYRLRYQPAHTEKSEVKR
jgi:hypothetical protein